MHGSVESIREDVVTLRAQRVDIEGQKKEVPAKRTSRLEIM
jgi:hypothetical protein